MPPEKGVMSKARALQVTALGLLVVVAILTASMVSEATPLETTIASVADDSAPRTAEQQALVDFAISRFEVNGLPLPEMTIEFHESLETCGWHKGLYVEQTRSLHMCSIDKQTMFHELAHAWANLNLSDSQREEFTARTGLDTWNSHDSEWEDRATEHVAETIAFALTDDPSDVEWVETAADGSRQVTRRILTIDVDTETLGENFVWLTGAQS